MEAQEYRLNGTYMPYDDQHLQYGEAPAGYQIRFINHIGRHGSRYPVSDENIIKLMDELQSASDQKILTEAGVVLLNQLSDWQIRMQGKWGNLSSLGEQQQKAIGARMAKYFGQAVFSNIRAWVDPKERCQLSYVNYLEGVDSILPAASRNPDVLIMEAENEMLNFFNTNTAYVAFKKSGNWESYYTQYEEQLLADNTIITKYITCNESVDIKRRIQFAQALYNCVSIAPDIPLAPEIIPIIEKEDMEKLWLLENAKQYMEKGPSSIADNIQINISLPLLKNFLTTSEEALHSDMPISFLRFAHAETLIPFAALLGIPSACAATSQCDQIARIWKDYEVSPMAANLVWVFYQNSEGKVLVKMLLNEKEVPFPVEAVQYPYYDWNVVRKYYVNQIDRLGK